MIKIKHKDIKIIRQNKINAQDNKCKLCEQEIDSPVLDHDHKSGLIRGVLCRCCNLFLARIENKRALYRMTDDDKLRTVLANTIEYLTTNHTDLIHPTFKKKF